MADTKITSGYDGLKLPYSPEAEQAVLGAILMEPEVIARVAEILPKSDYFYVTTHKLIYSAMMSMFTQGKTVDIITVLETLKTEKSFDEASGKTYLMQLAQSCPSISNIEEVAAILTTQPIRAITIILILPQQLEDLTMVDCYVFITRFSLQPGHGVYNFFLVITIHFPIVHQ